LKSIIAQDYAKNLIEIIIVDADSTDNTQSIAKNYHCQIYRNPLKTGEAGKAIGVKKATGDLVALVDSDNILPTSSWLNEMVVPFIRHPTIIGAEPWSFTYRPSAGFIERYSALIGANDPFILVSGNFDRQCLLFSHWTRLKLPVTDYPKYQIVTLNPRHLMPTIGANGTIFRRQIFSDYKSDYLFDIDLLYLQPKIFTFAKIKNGIIHTYCQSSIKKFYLKQTRRATDFYVFRHLRRSPFSNNNILPSIKFSLYTLSVIPLFIHTLVGFVKKPDIAWFFHPLACFITLYCYSLATVKNLFGFLRPLDRRFWSQ